MDRLVEGNLLPRAAGMLCLLWPTSIDVGVVSARKGRRVEFRSVVKCSRDTHSHEGRNWNYGRDLRVGGRVDGLASGLLATRLTREHHDFVGLGWIGVRQHERVGRSVGGSVDPEENRRRCRKSFGLVAEYVNRLSGHFSAEKVLPRCRCRTAVVGRCWCRCRCGVLVSPSRCDSGVWVSV